MKYEFLTSIKDYKKLTSKQKYFSYLIKHQFDKDFYAETVAVPIKPAGEVPIDSLVMWRLGLPESKSTSSAS